MTTARLNWFIDGELLGTVHADERLWWTPLPGRHEILVMDELGQTDKQILTVYARP